jgi:hypothetical protein
MMPTANTDELIIFSNSRYGLGIQILGAKRPTNKSGIYVKQLLDCGLAQRDGRFRDAESTRRLQRRCRKKPFCWGNFEKVKRKNEILNFMQLGKFSDFEARCWEAPADSTPLGRLKVNEI